MIGLLVVVFPAIWYWKHQLEEEHGTSLESHRSPEQTVIWSALADDRLAGILDTEIVSGEECSAHLFMDQTGRAELLLANGDGRKLAMFETPDHSWRIEATRRGRVVRVTALGRDESIPLRNARGRLGKYSRAGEPCG